MDITRTVVQQYASADPFLARRELHGRYSEHPDNLEEYCHEALQLKGDESIVDVGCGPGFFLGYLRAHRHRGRIVGFDQSTTMISKALARNEISSASERGLTKIEGCVGDVEHLPFCDGAFDRVSARHMLYHVPDIDRGVHELARVVRDDGLVLVITNQRLSMPRIQELRADCMRRFGIAATESWADRFNTDNAHSFLDPVFRSVEERIIENAIVLGEPEPIVRYVESMSIMSNANDGSGRSREEMLAWLQREVERRMLALGGIWRDPKSMSVYLCRR